MQAHPAALAAYDAVSAVERKAAELEALVDRGMRAAAAAAAAAAGVAPPAAPGGAGGGGSPPACVVLEPPAGLNWHAPFVVERSVEYPQYIAGGPRVTIFAGARVALVVSDGARAELGALEDVAAMAWIVDRLERMRDVFDATTGRVPLPPRPARISLDEGGEGAQRVPVEVAYLPGAGGLASHGVAGIAVGPGFLRDVYEAAHAAGAGRPGFAAGPGGAFIHHVFFYESTRNYIYPQEFTPLFDYEVAVGGPDSTGWVNQGFVDVLGALLAPQLPAAFHYYGKDRAGFMAGMEAQLGRYIAGGYAWDDVFMRERTPWDEHTSLDNVYAGLLVRVFKEAGGDGGDGGAMLKRFFRVAIPLMLQAGPARRPAHVHDVPKARDNLYIAFSVAAGRDLRELFLGTLRWPVSADGLAAAQALLAAAAAAAPPPAVIW
jgi:hypothetical protein